MIYQKNIVDNINCDNCSCKVRYILESTGFAEVWLYPESVIYIYIIVYTITPAGHSLKAKKMEKLE